MTPRPFRRTAARPFAALAALACLTGCASAPQARAPHNVIVFVADGLRSHSVTESSAPELARLRAEGVDFANSHSIYPTVTTANASAIATGHRLGDTGNFANTFWVGGPLSAAVRTPTPFVENDAILGLLNERYEGNYLGETAVLTAAARQGYSTAAIGKTGPVAIQAVTERDGRGTIVLDDAVGTPEGVPLDPDVARAIVQAGIDARPPDRRQAVEHQRWFAAVATRVLLPRFKQAGKPFALLYWSRDPDGTQHGQKDSVGQLTPGINGPSSLAAIRNADDALGELRRSLRALGLEGTTDVIVVADHGFSTVWRESATSAAARHHYGDTPDGQLPPGFLALDLGLALGLPVRDPESGRLIDPNAGAHPAGNALLGDDPAHPQVVVAANGGTDLLYVNGPDRAGLAARIVAAAAAQDYVTSVFVDDDLGPVPGALPLSRIGFVGTARTPRPAIVIGFASKSTGCADPELCTAGISDTSLAQGQGNHGSFSRADTHNFMAAVGPDFLPHTVSAVPASNADVGRTVEYLLRLRIPTEGRVPGRVLTEALIAGHPVTATRRVETAPPDARGFATTLVTQQVGRYEYCTVAGVPGRTVGLAEEAAR